MYEMSGLAWRPMYNRVRPTVCNVAQQGSLARQLLRTRCLEACQPNPLVASQTYLLAKIRPQDLTERTQNAMVDTRTQSRQRRGRCYSRACLIQRRPTTDVNPRHRQLRCTRRVTVLHTDVLRSCGNSSHGVKLVVAQSSESEACDLSM